jgi:hypothetical protein
MADTKPAAEDKAPLTGVKTTDDVLQFVAVHGPARNEAERAELLAVFDAGPPPVEQGKTPPTSTPPGSAAPKEASK